MSIHMPGFWLIFRDLDNFVVAKSATNSIMVKEGELGVCMDQWELI